MDSMSNFPHNILARLMRISVIKDNGGRCCNCCWKKDSYNMLGEFMYSKCNNPKHQFKIGDSKTVKSSVCLDFERGDLSSEEKMKDDCYFVSNINDNK